MPSRVSQWRCAAVKTARKTASPARSHASSASRPSKVGPLAPGLQPPPRPAAQHPRRRPFCANSATMRGERDPAEIDETPRAPTPGGRTSAIRDRAPPGSPARRRYPPSPRPRAGRSPPPPKRSPAAGRRAHRRRGPRRRRSSAPRRWRSSIRTAATWRRPPRTNRGSLPHVGRAGSYGAEPGDRHPNQRIAFCRLASSLSRNWLVVSQAGRRRSGWRGPWSSRRPRPSRRRPSPASRRTSPRRACCRTGRDT